MRLLRTAILPLPLMFLAACAGDSSEQAVNNAGNMAASARPQAAAPAASSRRHSGFDIAGLYLGMSPEEVTAALQAYDPSLAIRQDAVNFTYNALGQRHRTESYVNYMGGTVPGGSVSLEVRFSYPPEPLAVVAVYRGHRQQVEPITQAMYVESLIEKYGPPGRDSGSTGAGQRIERTLEWPIGNGTTQCMPNGVETDSTPPVLARIERRLPDPSLESVDTCISMLRYRLSGDPVVQASGAMYDVPAAAKAELRSRDWLQSLVEEKSRAGTERPRL